MYNKNMVELNKVWFLICHLCEFWLMKAVRILELFCLRYEIVHDEHHHYHCECV